MFLFTAFIPLLQISHLRSLCADLIDEVVRLNGGLLPQGGQELSPGVEEAAGE